MCAEGMTAGQAAAPSPTPPLPACLQPPAPKQAQEDLIEAACSRPALDHPEVGLPLYLLPPLGVAQDRMQVMCLPAGSCYTSHHTPHCTQPPGPLPRSALQGGIRFGFGKEFRNLISKCLLMESDGLNGISHLNQAVMQDKMVRAVGGVCCLPACMHACMPTCVPACRPAFLLETTPFD